MDIPKPKLDTKSAIVPVFLKPDYLDDVAQMLYIPMASLVYGKYNITAMKTRGHIRPGVTWTHLVQ